MKTLLSSIFIFLFSFILLSESTAQSYKVVVNDQNTTSSLSKKEVSDLLLKKDTKWSDGTPVVPVDLTSGSGVREKLSQDVHGKSTGAIRSYWQQAAFSGTASAPPEKASDAEVIEFVKRNPGAIGYVSSLANTAGVKTISIQ